jgi:ribosomal protein S18 acetylase RimI-like enzyme
MTSSSIIIQRGIPLELKSQAAKIYYEAFRQKLTPFIGADREQALRLLTADLNPEAAFIAVRSNQVLGVLGFHHAGAHLLDVRFGTIRQAFGLFGAIWRAGVGLLLERHPAEGEMLMDGIAVHADARGQGVGSGLIQALFDFAQAQGYTTVRLEVVDTNPRAQQLYERLGFIAIKTESVPFLRRLGFTAVTTMRHDLTPAAHAPAE